MFEEISFPEHEYESVQNYLNKLGYCYTTRVYKEIGKYQVGKLYTAPWGDILKIDEVKTYRKVSERPFYAEMSDDEKSEIRKYSEDMGLPYEFIKFSKAPFWERAYREKDMNAFSTKPNATITEFENLFCKEATVLDVGCGEGQNAIYLAKQGYNVDAFDISECGIAKVTDRCKALGVKLNAFAADLRGYEFKHDYDVIMSFGTLHFVSKDDWKRFITEAKAHTNDGGIHIMQLFTDDVPASEDIAPFAVGLAKDEEIKELYEDWEVLQFKSYVFEDEHPGVPKHLHASNKIVVRKR